jgi:hypothetical protein
METKRIWVFLFLLFASCCVSMTNNDTYLTVYATNFINYTTRFGPNGPSSGVSIYTLSTYWIATWALYILTYIHRSYTATLIFTSTLLGDYIFQHPVALKYSLHSIITVFNATFCIIAFKTVIIECKDYLGILTSVGLLHLLISKLKLLFSFWLI